MRSLGTAETILIGQWVKINNRIVEDEVSERISWLIDNHLEKVSDAPGSGGWITLFRDPSTSQYWELSYPESELHGGGPPTLRLVDQAYLQEKYGLQS